MIDKMNLEEAHLVIAFVRTIAASEGRPLSPHEDEMIRDARRILTDAISSVEMRYLTTPKAQGAGRVAYLE